MCVWLGRPQCIGAAKHRVREKRGGGQSRVTLRDMFLLSEGRQLDIIALDEALTELTTINPLTCPHSMFQPL